MSRTTQTFIAPVANPIIAAKAIDALKSGALPGVPASSGAEEPATRISGLFGHNPLQNHVLATLHPTEFSRIAPHLELVNLQCDATVCQADEKMTHLYFPTNCILSLLHETEDGNSAETAVIGHEGVAGVALFMGGERSMGRIAVKCGGYAFRLKASALLEEFSRGGALQRCLLRYTHGLISQMSQTAVCNRHHGVMQQLCRWLLLTLDRLPDNKIGATQNFIALSVGVRRESIAEAAKKLQRDGVIDYSRGQITIQDRAALERDACECYRELRVEYDRFLAYTDA